MTGRYLVKVNGWPWGTVEHDGSKWELLEQQKARFPGCEVSVERERTDTAAAAAPGAKYGNWFHQQRLGGRFDGYSADTREAMAIARSRTHRAGGARRSRQW